MIELLTELELCNIENDDELRFGIIDRLIADHRRLTEAIRTARHDIAAPDGYWCAFSYIQRLTDCTRENCIWMECQP